MYFTEVITDGQSKYIPRSVQIDLEAGVCNRVSYTHRPSYIICPDYLLRFVAALSERYSGQIPS